MKDWEYKRWALDILKPENLPREGVHIDIGAGMGKLLAISQKERGAFGLGVEPAPTAVCNGWRIYPDVELHLGDGNDFLACLDSGIADLVTTVGVIEYFPNLEYLCTHVHHALRVLKPGGVLQHNWIVYSPQLGGKGDDKLNIHPNFWGGRWKSWGLGWGKRWHRDLAAERREGVKVLPACAGSMGVSVDADSIEIFTNEYGPTNGYSVRLMKRGARSMSPELSARNSRLRSSTTFS
jgi:SAM-dependent methyltransferase